jgi:hypothetical protein
MRSRVLACVALALSLAFPAAGTAQTGPIPRVSIDGVHVGFKAGEQGSGAKVGFWTPVYVEVKAGLSPITAIDGSVVVESADTDQLQNTYSVPLPSLAAKETGTVIAYARLANQDGELIITIRDHDGREVARTRARGNTEAGKTGYAARPPASVLYRRRQLRQHGPGAEQAPQGWSARPRRLSPRWDAAGCDAAGAPAAAPAAGHGPSSPE